jgi:hypothetical protein
MVRVVAQEVTLILYRVPWVTVEAAAGGALRSFPAVR